MISSDIFLDYNHPAFGTVTNVTVYSDRTGKFVSADQFLHQVNYYTAYGSKALIIKTELYQLSDVRELGNLLSCLPTMMIPVIVQTPLSKLRLIRRVSRSVSGLAISVDYPPSIVYFKTTLALHSICSQMGLAVQDYYGNFVDVATYISQFKYSYFVVDSYRLGMELSADIVLSLKKCTINKKTLPILLVAETNAAFV